MTVTPPWNLGKDCKMNSISDLHYYLLCFLLLLFSAFLLRSISNKSSKSAPGRHLAPSPPSLPIIGHLHHVRPVLHKSFHHLSSKYGPLLYLRLGSYPCLVVSTSSMAEEIFKTQDVNFAARPVSPFGDGLLFGNDGFITAMYGDYWRFMKKLCVTELLGTRQVERSRAVRHQEITRFLRQMIQSASNTEVVDVGARLMKLTNNIICRMVMSTSCSEEDDEAERIRELVKRSFELAGKMSLANSLGPLKKFGFWLYAKEAKEVTTRYDELLEKLLKEHEERAKSNDREGNKDLMDILLEAYHDDEAEFRITLGQLKSFILDLFIGGTSTSAETMQWAVAELINHPTVYKIARDEIESVVGRSRLVEETDIPSLHYLQAIVKETLRLHPNSPLIPRVCHQGCKINGFDIPARTPVAVNVYSIARDPAIWENPNEFCPERFLVSSKTETKGQNFDFTPFGGGRRACPGKNLAYAVMNTAIASMIQCIDWKVIGEDGDGAKLSMQEAIGMSLTMASPLRCLPLVYFNPFEA
ncbi:Cytochrome P450 - like 10 [Theobroma cacao]|nr:Cytochrome P450 - like 10 [Theobroma cacao]